MKSIFIQNKLINLSYVARVDRWHCPAQVGTEGDQRGKHFPEHNQLKIIFGVNLMDVKISFETELEMAEALAKIKAGMECIDL